MLSKLTIGAIISSLTLQAIVIDMVDYKVDYNTSLNAPMSVSYNLTKQQVECKSIHNRLSYFKRVKLPNNSYTPSSKHYKYSGYDKGHLASDASFDCNITQLRRTYTTINIVPMKPKVNRVLWLQCERLERVLAKIYTNVYVTNKLTYNGLYLNNVIPIPSKYEKTMSFNNVTISCIVDNNETLTIR